MMKAITAGDDFRWLFRAAGRLEAQAVSVQNKRQKVVPTDQLVELGFKLMNHAEELVTKNAIKAAWLYRDGLMIALLALRPLRRRNFSAITLGQHLVDFGDEWMLRFEASETKQRRPIEMVFPASLVDQLRRYISQHRPLLAGAGSCRGTAGDALWVSRDGGPLTPHGFWQVIARRTKDEFGYVLNPHLFRDCAATTIAIDDPGHATTIAPLLGHSSMATSERSYNQARSIEAGRDYQTVLASLRRAASGTAARANLKGAHKQGPVTAGAI
jgi:integrase